ncbi:MAG: hypothetical protein AAGU11_06710 [Syntrophobacteraceae bacterium]
MRASNVSILDTGIVLPSFELALASGKTIEVPYDLGDVYSVIFFYRGYW